MPPPVVDQLRQRWPGLDVRVVPAVQPRAGDPWRPRPPKIYWLDGPAEPTVLGYLAGPGPEGDRDVAQPAVRVQGAGHLLLRDVRLTTVVAAVIDAIFEGPATAGWRGSTPAGSWDWPVKRMLINADLPVHGIAATTVEVGVATALVMDQLGDLPPLELTSQLEYVVGVVDAFGLDRLKAVARALA